MAELWGIAYDIYWRCRWGSGYKPSAAYLRAHAECERIIHDA